MRCFLSLPALHRIHDWALLSSPRLGESSLVGIDLQPMIVLLSWNKKKIYINAYIDGTKPWHCRQ